MYTQASISDQRSHMAKKLNTDIFKNVKVKEYSNGVFQRSYNSIGINKSGLANVVIFGMLAIFMMTAGLLAAICAPGLIYLLRLKLLEQLKGPSPAFMQRFPSAKIKFRTQGMFSPFDPAGLTLYRAYPPHSLARFPGFYIR